VEDINSTSLSSNRFLTENYIT